MSGPQKVSFTVRRPTPVSRATSSGPESDSSSFKVPLLPRHLQPLEFPPSGSPLARTEANSSDSNEPDGSSDEDDVVQDELVTGFDKFGVERCVNSFLHFLQSSQLTEVVIDDTWVCRLHQDRKKKKRELLVIPALKNKDWRELARKRRSAQQYIPVSATVHTGTDGSVGGLGTKDVIGAGPALSGLQSGKKIVKVEVDEDTMVKEEVVEDIKIDLSEDEVARRAILAEASGLASNVSIVDVIPTPISEGDAYKQDVEELPEVASLEDYARVPVEQFGAAMLRGMGWTEGTAASKSGKGHVQPYLPTARPALLGIGAKEMEAFDDGSKKKGSSRPEKRYVPVVKRELKGGDTPGSGRERSQSPSRSRRNSPSAEEHTNLRRRGESDHRRDRDRVREREREQEHRNKARGKYREKERDRERNGDQRKRDRRTDYDRNRPDGGDRSRDASRRRDYKLG